MSLRTADLVNLGYLPLRHHEPDYDLNLRAVAYGFRVDHRDPRTGAYVHVEGEDGDLVNPSVWKLSDAKEGVHDRPMAAWSHAWPAVVVRPEDDASAGASRETTTLRSSGKQQVQPLRLAADTDGDKRFEPKTPGYPSWASRLPRGWPVQVVAGTEEHSQEDLLFPAAMGLVAAEHAGGANLSTALLDLDGDSRPDGERRALLHRHLRVVRKPTGMGFDGTSSIAMQAGFSGRDGGAGLLLIADSAGAAPSAPADGQDAADPDSGGDTSIRARGGAAPGTTERGGTAPRTSARGAQAVLGATGWRGGGPLLVPGPGDQHQIGVSADGEPIFATHQNADTIIYGHGGDGPWHFLDSIYRDPGPHPMRTRVHFEFDPKEPHNWIGGTGAGKWKASAESILYVSKKKIDPPPIPDPEPTGPIPPGGGGDGSEPWTWKPRRGGGDQPPPPPPPPPVGDGDGTISRTGGPADPPPTPPLPPTPPREGGNIDDPSGPGDGSENGDTSLRNPWENPPPEPPTPPIDDPLNPDPGADGDPYAHDPDPNDPSRKLFPPRFGEPRRFPGAAIARGRPVLGADLGDWNRDLACSTMEIAVPAILFRPQKYSGGAPVDLRNDPSPAAADVDFHDENSPVTARIEAAYAGGCTPSYTRAPGVGRYGGGTASCALTIMPPEVDHADDAQDYAPSGVSVSDVALIALRERVRIGWGRPCLKAGATTMVRDGFSSILNAAGALLHESHDSAGVNTTETTLDTSVGLTLKRALAIKYGTAYAQTHAAAAVTAARAVNWPDADLFPGTGTGRSREIQDAMTIAAGYGHAVPEYLQIDAGASVTVQAGGALVIGTSGNIDLAASGDVRGILPVANGGSGTSSPPAAGQIPVGNAGGTAYAAKTVSADATLDSTGALTLAASGVAAGTYTKITVDAKGRATVGATGNLATDFTGTLPAGNGGTGQATLPTYGQALMSTSDGTAFTPAYPSVSRSISGAFVLDSEFCARFERYVKINTAGSYQINTGATLVLSGGGGAAAAAA